MESPAEFGAHQLHLWAVLSYDGFSYENQFRYDFFVCF